MKQKVKKTIKEQWIPKDETTCSTPHRLTFLVGFWTRQVPDKMKYRKLYGPCGPLPPRPTEEEKDDENQVHTWVEEIHQGYDDKNRAASTPHTMTTTPVPMIAPAWEVMGTAATAVEEKKDDKDDDERKDELEIPRAIDHRFFVRDAPTCFRDSLFERDCYGDDDDVEEEEEEEEG